MPARSSSRSRTAEFLQPGEVKALVAYRHGSGFVPGPAVGVRVAVSPAAEARLLEQADDAYNHALYAAAQFFELFLPSGHLSPYLPGLRNIRPVDPQPELGVDGYSIGFPFFLAILSSKLSRGIVQNCYATGVIKSMYGLSRDQQVQVAGNRADETATKLHTPGLAGGLVLMQAEDVHGLSESQRHWVAPVLYPRTEMPVLAQARLHPMLCSHAKKAPAA